MSALRVAIWFSTSAASRVIEGGGLHAPSLASYPARSVSQAAMTALVPASRAQLGLAALTATISALQTAILFSTTAIFGECLATVNDLTAIDAKK
jgi:hypothetical protein